LKRAGSELAGFFVYFFNEKKIQMKIKNKEELSFADETGLIDELDSFVPYKLIIKSI